MDNTEHKIQQFASGVDYLVRHVIDTADVDISRMRAALYIARTAVDTIVQDGANGARAAAWATDSWVRTNPWKAVGISAVIGAVAGVLISRPRLPRDG